MVYLYYVVIDTGNGFNVFPCKYKPEAMEIVRFQEAVFPDADIIVTKSIYSQMKVKVEV